MGIKSGVKVSVIMNCLNEERNIRQAIDSVFNQTFKDWEIVFWDNGSTDKSAEIAKSYGEKVRYFFSEQTFPLGKARNLCIDKAKGEFIAFLDCDDIWFPQKLEKQIPLFEKDLDVGLVFSDAIYFGEKGEICQIFQKFKPPRGNIFSCLLRKYFICMTSVVIRRSAIENTALFDERLRYCEDANLIFKLAYKFKLDYCDEPLVKYYVSVDSRSLKYFAVLAQERDMTLQALRKEFPDIDEKFSEDIKIFQAKTNAQKAINEWTSGHSSRARSIIKLIHPKNPLIYALYLITFLPRSTFKILFILNYRIKSWVN
jgi:glycosyltransferase involved in cell wall biosynthesis